MISLLTPNGILALREGLLSVEDASRISELKYLLSDNGILALRNEWITPEQAKKFRHSGSSMGTRSGLLRVLLTESGLLFLSNHYVSPYIAPYIKNLSAVFKNDAAVKIFEQKQISLAGYPEHPSREEIKQANNIISNLLYFTKDGASELVKSGHLDINAVTSIESLEILSYPNGVKLIQEGVITIEESSGYFTSQNIKPHNASKKTLFTTENIHCNNHSKFMAWPSSS